MILFEGRTGAYPDEELRRVGDPREYDREAGARNEDPPDLPPLLAASAGFIGMSGFQTNSEAPSNAGNVFFINQRTRVGKTSTSSFPMRSTKLREAPCMCTGRWKPAHRVISAIRVSKRVIPPHISSSFLAALVHSQAHTSIVSRCGMFSMGRTTQNHVIHHVLVVVCVMCQVEIIILSCFFQRVLTAGLKNREQPTIATKQNCR